jgi:hypothetical protein
VRAASIVLVPEDGFRDFAGPVFPEGTINFLTFLRDHTQSPVEILIDDPDYAEVAIHFDILRLATMIVEEVVAPIVLSVIAAYMKDWLGSRMSRTEVRAKLLVHHKDDTKEQTIQYSYEGPADKFEQTVANALRGRSQNTPINNEAVTPAPTVEAAELIAKRKKRKRRAR